MYSHEISVPCRHSNWINSFLVLSFSVHAEEDILLHWRFDPHAEYIEADASGRGHDAQLLRNDHNRPEPVRVLESIHGTEAGSVRLTRDSRVRLLSPVELPETWTLCFWIKDGRSRGRIPEELVVGDFVRIRSQLIGLPNPWYFQFDSQERGEDAGWADGKNGDWQEIKVPAFWHETHVGRAHGYGWYKTEFYVPEEYADMEHVLHFEAVDEQAWVYVNGKYVGEQTEESTGKSFGELWDEPFSVTVTPEHLRGGEDNILVVRSHASRLAAGIFRPVYFLPPENKRAELDISLLSGERMTPGGWEHVAVASEPDKTRLYINGILADTVEGSLWDNIRAAKIGIEFSQRGWGHFGGLLDDVRFYAGALSEESIAGLSEGIYHPEASWLAEYDEEVQNVAKIGRLSRERTQYMTELGVPDTHAVFEIVETDEDVFRQLDAIWALGAIGDYDAAAILIELLDAEAEDIANASEDALLMSINEEHYPQALVERADEEAVSMLETVTMKTDNVKLQDASVDGLREITGDFEAIAVLIRKLDSDQHEISATAEDGLVRFYEEGASRLF